jgi:hypothetical protein
MMRLATPPRTQPAILAAAVRTLVDAREMAFEELEYRLARNMGEVPARQVRP